MREVNALLNIEYKMALPIRITFSIRRSNSIEIDLPNCFRISSQFSL